VGDEAVFHGLLKGAAGLVDHRVALELDHRLFDVGVDVAEQAGEQVRAHHPGASRLWPSAVVALV
jgi:hypothetical protein